MFVKKSLLLVNLLTILQNTNSSNDFLYDFFKYKSVTITLHVCWNRERIKNLLTTTMHSHNPKQTSVYSRHKDYHKFLNHLSTNNYFVVDLQNCSNSWLLMDKVQDLQLFRYPMKWLILSDEKNFVVFMNVLRNYSIFPASEVIVSKQTEDSFGLFQFYRIDNIGELIREDYGSWTKENGLRENFKHIPPTQRRRNLQQARMNVSVYINNNDTWNHLEDFKNPRIDMWTKVTYLATKVLLEYCNISFTSVATTSFGYYDVRQGKLNGVIGDLHYGKAQISGSSPIFLPERAAFVEFIKMTNPAQNKFVLMKPPLSYVKNIFAISFYWTVWAAMGIVLGLFAIGLFVILNWEVKLEKVRTNPTLANSFSDWTPSKNSKDNYTVSDVSLIIFEAICQQGTTTESKSLAGRIIAFILFMALMFLYVAYSENIVSLLQSSGEITSLEELLNVQIAAGGEKSTYMARYLTEANDTIRKKLYKKKIGTDGYYSMQEGVGKIKQGFFAYHGDLSTMFSHILETFTDYEVCGLQELEGYVKTPGGYTCVPKNSPYKEIFKVGLLRIHEYGIQQRNLLRVYKRPECFSQGGSFQTIGIVDIYPALLILIYGYVASFVIFFGENFIHKLKLNKKEENGKNLDIALFEFVN